MQVSELAAYSTNAKCPGFSTSTGGLTWPLIICIGLKWKTFVFFPLPYIYFTPRWENSGIFSAFLFIKQSRGNEGQVSPMVLGFYFIFILFLGLVKH